MVRGDNEKMERMWWRDDDKMEQICQRWWNEGEKLNEYADSEEKYDDDEDCFADILELFSNLPQFKLFQETQTNILKLFSICPNFCIFVHSD